MTYPCDCPGRHVTVTIRGVAPQEGVHLVDWHGRTPAPGGTCPRAATQEDGKCDLCRDFLTRYDFPETVAPTRTTGYS